MTQYNTLNVKLSNSQLNKLRFLGRLLGPLLKTGLPLMKNVLKIVLIPLGLTAAAAATDAAFIRKYLDLV